MWPIWKISLGVFVIFAIVTIIVGVVADAGNGTVYFLIPLVVAAICGIVYLKNRPLNLSMRKGIFH